MANDVKEPRMPNRISRYLAPDRTLFGLPRLDSAEIDSLRRFVQQAGRHAPALELGRAMRMLVANDRSDASVAALARVLGDADTTASLRAQAAANLGRIAGPAATKGLLAALPDAPARTQIAILTALARVGTQDALAAVTRLTAPPGTRLADMRDFAATLIAVRAGIDIPKGAQNAVLPKTTAIKTRAETAKTARSVITALADAGFDTALTPERALSYTCEDTKHVVLFAEPLAGARAAAALQRHSMIAGIVACEDRAAHRFVARYIIVTQPERAGVRVSLVTPNGAVAFVGGLTPDEDGQALRLSDIAATGTPLDVTGRLHKDGAFALDLRTLTDRKRPKRTGEAVDRSNP
ncbi:MAG: HEAT repeat domain-containing protein [Pseudomonadota bacterium]